MIQTSSTIAAIATPMGVGGIGIIRLSGPDAISIAQKLSSFTHPLKYRYCYTKRFSNPISKKAIDDGCILFFKGPSSYTGEDCVELHLHGSPHVLKECLLILIELGAVLAGKGEFTKRAFINGKLDLTKAESVIDMIHATNKASQAVALNHLKGALFKRIYQMRQVLIDGLEHIEGSIDFPDEVPPLDRVTFFKKINEILATLTQMIKNEDYGKWVHEGINVVIVGKPNVGKSSLLNGLLGENRAIVTPIAGTTRDFIEGKIQLNGMQINVFDTAGIRESDDIIEYMGIKKIKSLIKHAQLIIWMVDHSSKWDDDDDTIYSNIKRKKHILIIKNKIDKKKTQFNCSNYIKKTYPELALSLKTNQGLDNIKKIIQKEFIEKVTDEQLELMCNIRQISCLKEVKKSLRNIIKQQALEDDVLSIDIKAAILKLGELTGEDVTEEVLDGIFSRFCVGK